MNESWIAETQEHEDERDDEAEVDRDPNPAVGHHSRGRCRLIGSRGYWVDQIADQAEDRSGDRAGPSDPVYPPPFIHRTGRTRTDSLTRLDHRIPLFGARPFCSSNPA
jgi:hypothetical protein